jgi:hypothetical protein
VPKDIIIHHANWTVGIDNKIKLLDIVKKKVSGHSKEKIKIDLNKLFYMSILSIKDR